MISVDDGFVKVNAPASAEVKFIGADFPQVVDDELKIHTPLTDTQVTLSFAATLAGKRTENDVRITVKGRNMRSAGKKPCIIPEPAQWLSEGSGFFRAEQVCAVLYSDESLASAAGEFSAELGALCGVDKSPQLSEKRGDKSIFFEISGAVSYLGQEGYEIMTGTDGIKITVSDRLGAIWAGKTVLQLFVQSGFPYGEMRDYPRYPVRGFMLDVARRPMTLEMLKKIVKYMAWYKMNDFHIHLNDNHIFLENYYGNNEESTFDAYDAFRLESSLKNDRGESPTAKDYSYTKAQFRDFIAWAAERGVRITPEIDVPAHALSFTKVFPEYMVRGKTSPLMKKRALTDHIDISRRDSVDFVKKIFDDYTGGDEPVFGKDVTVHIGADEFLTDYGAYRRFINEIVPYIKQTNKVRIWGGLTWIKDDPATEIVPQAIDGVQMNLWSSSWADGREMYDMGYELINTIDHYLYMVPNGTRLRGMYTDLLNKNKIFRSFSPSHVRLKGVGKYIDLPAGDKKVLGAAYAIWHDNIDKRASGLTQGDTFDRFMDSAPLMAEKEWGSLTDKASGREVDRTVALIGSPEKLEAHTNGEIDLPSLSLTGCEYKNGALVLGGGSSYANNSFESIALNTEITIDICFNSVEPGQIIMECDELFGSPYDLRITKSGRLGFTREGYEYEFDYEPPVGKRLRLRIITKPLRTVLKTGCITRKKALGRFVHNNIVKRTGIKNSTLLLPCLRIGSETNAVNAQIYKISFKSI